jgi:hypothetical protein
VEKVTGMSMEKLLCIGMAAAAGLSEKRGILLILTKKDYFTY